MANIFGFSAMKDKVKSIKYDSEVEDAFIVTNENDEISEIHQNKGRDVCIQAHRQVHQEGCMSERISTTYKL